LVSREWADTLAERVERIRDERDEAYKQRDTAVFNRKQVLRQYAELDEKYTAVCIVNACLTEDLAKVRAKLAASMDAESALARQIHEMAQPVEPTDAEMDALNLLIQERDSEKKRADSLQEQLAEARAQPADSLAGQLRAELKREKRRADRLEKQYYDAVGLGPNGIQDSSRWQPGYQDPKAATS
jgi:hypothetical protein